MSPQTNAFLSFPNFPEMTLSSSSPQARLRLTFSASKVVVPGEFFQEEEHAKMSHVAYEDLEKLGPTYLISSLDE